MDCLPAHIPRSMLLQWHLTERCNLRCSHCYQEGGQSYDELPYSFLLELVDQFTELVAYWRRESGGNFQSSRIVVTGGEPFLRSDFLDLIRVFAERRESFSFAILTNGTYIDESVARELQLLGAAFVQVSIEGGKSTHDLIRCGSFEKTVRGIKCLTRAGLRTLVSFTAHSKNYKEFPEVAKIGRQLGVSRVWTDRFIPISAGSQMENRTLTPEETEELVKLIHQTKKRSYLPWRRKTEIASLRALQFLGGTGGAPYSCSAGDTLLTIQANGDLVPCRRMPIVVGSLLKTPLKRLYEDSPILRELRKQHVPNECRNCAHGLKCRGGLRCLAYAVTGDYFKADPGCWLAERG